MYQEFKNKYIEKLDKTVGSILIELKKDTEKFWDIAIKDISEKELLIEREVELKEAEKVALDEQILVLSDEVIALNKANKVEKENIDKYKMEKKKLLDNIMDIEKREENINLRIKKIEAREVEITKKEEEVKIQVNLLEQKQKNLSSIYEKLKGG